MIFPVLWGYIRAVLDLAGAGYSFVRFPSKQALSVADCD